MTEPMIGTATAGELLWLAVKLTEVMEAPVPTVWELDRFSKVATAFAEHDTMYVCVVDRQGYLVGTISHQFMYRTQAPRRALPSHPMPDSGVVVDGDTYYPKEALDGIVIRQVMNDDPCCMGPDATLGAALQQMSSLDIGCIPVITQDRKVLGLVTHRSVIVYLASHVARPGRAER